jgi:lysophospholipase L1-like esterase
MTTRFAVLGDSIAWGQGASRESERLGPRLVEALALRGHEVELRVLAVPGARSSGLAAQVERVRGWRPDLVLIVIGANDLTHLEPVEPAVQALGRAVGALRESAEVVVAPAPDLSAVPHVPVALRPVVQAAGDAFRARQVQTVLDHGGLVADPDQRASHAFATDPRLFSRDRFHPSGAGYAVIADSVLPVLLEALGRAERAS